VQRALRLKILLVAPQHGEGSRISLLYITAMLVLGDDDDDERMNFKVA